MQAEQSDGSHPAPPWAPAHGPESRGAWQASPGPGNALGSGSVSKCRVSRVS